MIGAKRRALWGSSAAGSGVASSDSNIQAWITAVGQNNTNAREVSILTAMAVAMKADGSWQKLDRLWIFALGTQTAALTDLIVQATATLPVAPTFTAQLGFTGNGSTQYISSGYNPSTGTLYKQNDACMGGFIQTNDSRTSGNPCYFGSSSQGGGGTNLTRSAATTNNYCLQDGTAGLNNATMSPTNGSGLNHMDRTGAGAEALYQNGVSRATSTQASTTVVNAVMFALATNNASGTPVLFNNGVLSSLFAGGSMGSSLAASFNTDMHTALNSINATNFP